MFLLFFFDTVCSIVFTFQSWIIQKNLNLKLQFISNALIISDAKQIATKCVDY